MCEKAWKMQTPIFWIVFDDEKNYVYLVILKRNVNELYLKRVYRPHLIISHVMTQNDGWYFFPKKKNSLEVISDQKEMNLNSVVNCPLRTL